MGDAMTKWLNDETTINTARKGHERKAKKKCILIINGLCPCRSWCSSLQTDVGTIKQVLNVSTMCLAVCFWCVGVLVCPVNVAKTSNCLCLCTHPFGPFEIFCKWNNALHQTNYQLSTTDYRLLCCSINTQSCFIVKIVKIISKTEFGSTQTETRTRTETQMKLN